MTTRDYLEFYYYCILRDFFIVLWVWLFILGISYAAFG